MAEYIERDKLFRAFERAAWYNNADRDEIAEELLMQIPSADVAPVVRGRWELEGGDDDLDLYGWCSVCNGDCEQHMLNWLKQPYKEDTDG